MNYTLQQLIDEWKLRRGLEPVRSDAAFHRFDALDIDAYIARRVDAWYHSLLDSGPLTHLVVHDIAPFLEPVSLSPSRGVYILPDGCRRIVAVTVAPEAPDAIIAAPGSPLALRQECPFCRGEGGAPVAVAHSGRLIVYGRSIPSGGTLHHVGAVLTPPEGVYELSPEALDSIPMIEP